MVKQKYFNLQMIMTIPYRCFTSITAFVKNYILRMHNVISTLTNNNAYLKPLQLVLQLAASLLVLMALNIILFVVMLVLYCVITNFNVLGHLRIGLAHTIGLILGNWLATFYFNWLICDAFIASNNPVVLLLYSAASSLLIHTPTMLLTVTWFIALVYWLGLVVVIIGADLKRIITQQDTLSILTLTWAAVIITCMVLNPNTSYCDVGNTHDHGSIKQPNILPVVLVGLGFATIFYYVGIAVFKFVTHVLQIVKRLLTRANTWYHDQPFWAGTGVGFLIALVLAISVLAYCGLSYAIHVNPDQKGLQIVYSWFQDTLQGFASRSEGKAILKQLLPSERLSYCDSKDSENSTLSNSTSPANPPKRTWIGWLLQMPPSAPALPPIEVKPKTTAALVLNESRQVIEKANLVCDNVQKQLLSMDPDLSPKTRLTLQGKLEGMREIKAMAEQGYFNQVTLYTNRVLTEHEAQVAQQNGLSATQIVSTQVGQALGQAASKVATPFMQQGAEAAAEAVGATKHNRKNSVPGMEWWQH